MTESELFKLLAKIKTARDSIVPDTEELFWHKQMLFGAWYAVSHILGGVCEADWEEWLNKGVEVIPA